MKKRAIQILAVIFAVGILVTSFVVPAAAAEIVNEVTHYDGMVKDVMYFDDASAPEGYGIRSNLNQHYTVKTGENAIQFSNDGLQSNWAWWQTPYFSDDGTVLFAQEYVVFDNKIPQITYQFIAESGAKIQVARFTTNSKLYYYRNWPAQYSPPYITTFEPTETDQICAFRDEFYYYPMTRTLRIRRWYWTNGNYDTPAYKFEVTGNTDMTFLQSDGTYAPENFKIRGYIQHTDEYFAENQVPIQLTRQVARTAKIALSHEDFLEYQGTIAGLEEELESLEYDHWLLDQSYDDLLEMYQSTEAERDELLVEKETWQPQIDQLTAENEMLVSSNASLQEGLANNNALYSLSEGVFNGMKNLLIPFFDFSFGGVSIATCVAFIVLIMLIRLIVNTARGT